MLGMWGHLAEAAVTISLGKMADVIAAAAPSAPSTSRIADTKAKFTTFDPPGSVNTYVTGLNRKGWITGYFEDGGATWHGYVRTSGGGITAFDPAGSIDTEARSINTKNVIAGYYEDGGSAHHGFVRAADGAITSFSEMFPEPLGARTLTVSMTEARQPEPGKDENGCQSRLCSSRRWDNHHIRRSGLRQLWRDVGIQYQLYGCSGGVVSERYDIY